MNVQPPMRLNTLDGALQLAHALSRELASEESKAQRSLRIFTALTRNREEAFVAFLIWRAQGAIVQELLKHR